MRKPSLRVRKPAFDQQRSWVRRYCLLRYHTKLKILNRKTSKDSHAGVKDSELVVWLNIQEFLEHFTGCTSVVKCGCCVSCLLSGAVAG